MAATGMKAHEALRIATTMRADAIGLGTDVGSLESGKLADLVVLTGNPAGRPSEHQDRRARDAERSVLPWRDPRRGVSARAPSTPLSSWDEEPDSVPDPGPLSASALGARERHQVSASAPHHGRPARSRQSGFGHRGGGQQQTTWVPSVTLPSRTRDASPFANAARTVRHRLPGSELLAQTSLGSPGAFRSAKWHCSRSAIGDVQPSLTSAGCGGSCIVPNGTPRQFASVFGVLCRANPASASRALADIPTSVTSVLTCARQSFFFPRGTRAGPYPGMAAHRVSAATAAGRIGPQGASRHACVLSMPGTACASTSTATSRFVTSGSIRRSWG